MKINTYWNYAVYPIPSPPLPIPSLPSHTHGHSTPSCQRLLSLFTSTTSLQSWLIYVPARSASSARKWQKCVSVVSESCASIKTLTRRRLARACSLFGFGASSTELIEMGRCWCWCCLTLVGCRREAAADMRTAQQAQQHCLIQPHSHSLLLPLSMLLFVCLFVFPCTSQNSAF